MGQLLAVGPPTYLWSEIQISSTMDSACCGGRVAAPRFFAPLVCVVLLFSKVTTGDDLSVDEQIRTLRSQVEGLLERRQEDFRILEETIRQSVDKSSEVVSLRHELDKLRREVDNQRSEKTGGHEKNDHLTVHWLSTAVTELRAEMTELAVAVNISADLQSRQEVTAGLDLLRGDLASFRRDLEELGAEQQQTVVTLGQLKQDVDASVRNSQSAVGLLTETKTEMLGTKDQVNGLTKSLHKLRRQLKVVRTLHKGRSSEEVHESDDYSNHINTPADDASHIRHHRLLRAQLSEIRKAETDLQARQYKLDGILRKMEDRIHSFITPKDLESRILKLEMVEKNADKKIFNVSKHVAELDRLRLSLLQLLESVETLETKVDSSLPNLQREISKIEFGAAQTTSTVAAVKEELENQQNSVKALSSSVENMQEKLQLTNSRMTSLHALYNATPAANVNCTSQTHPPMRLNVSTVSNNTLLPDVFSSLRQMEADYHNLVHQLPFDCSNIRGPNGVYPIAPGEGPPLLTFCDAGWTVVQRRIDGSEDFNRKWNDYAVGFGTPSDEFWLGNEALHRLTADNCSSLRIDLTDIYGKASAAEYEHFHIGSASDGFRISVSGYSGNASDALDYQNQMQFSTVDSDRDISNSHCAANYEGGWWFSHCQHANLNGRYNLGLTWFDGARNEWIAVAVSEMKIRRKSNCEKT